jgi:hypothetical protein
MRGEPRSVSLQNVCHHDSCSERAQPSAFHRMDAVMGPRSGVEAWIRHSLPDGEFGIP